jgi:hypothetical protein
MTTHESSSFSCRTAKSRRENSENLEAPGKLDMMNILVLAFIAANRSSTVGHVSAFLLLVAEGVINGAYSLGLISEACMYVPGSSITL